MYQFEASASPKFSSWIKELISSSAEKSQKEATQARLLYEGEKRKKCPFLKNLNFIDTVKISNIKRSGSYFKKMLLFGCFEFQVRMDSDSRKRLLPLIPKVIEGTSGQLDEFKLRDYLYSSGLWIEVNSPAPFSGTEFSNNLLGLLFSNYKSESYERFRDGEDKIFLLEGAEGTLVVTVKMLKAEKPADSDVWQAIKNTFKKHPKGTLLVICEPLKTRTTPHTKNSSVFTKVI